MVYVSCAFLAVRVHLIEKILNRDTCINHDRELSLSALSIEIFSNRRCVDLMICESSEQIQGIDPVRPQP